MAAGASGRRRDRRATLAELPTKQGAFADRPRHESGGPSGTALAPHLVPVPYEATPRDRRTRRGSTRRKPDEGTDRRTPHHPGTLVPPEKDG
ncbi:hypothetical protein ACIQU5_01500 [Streptomyces sp. NPDC090306]|uniref:hypothetical protein n=1 Tax=Streptomyces sp. NPDC090306 TaxID=3365961 RepID=UPI00381D7BEC